MTLKKGISPVVGILLMIVIAAVVTIMFSTLSTQITQKIEPTPVVLLNIQFYKDAVILEHAGGDPFNIRFASLMVTTHSRTYRIPFFENYLSRDVVLEAGEIKAVMLDECDYFDTYGKVVVYWKDKIIANVGGGVISEWYSPSFVVGYGNTLGVNSFLGVAESESEIMAAGSPYTPPPYNGLIVFLDRFGNVRGAYSVDFTIRDVARCSDGYVVTGYRYTLKVNSSGGVVWTDLWPYHIRSVACKGNVCALAGFQWSNGYTRIVLINASNGERLSLVMSYNLRVDRDDGCPIRIFSVKDGWLVVGRTNGGYGFVGLFDDNLNPRFVKWFTNVYAIRGAAEAQDGYVLVGTTTGEDDVAVIKIDRKGDISWAKRYDAGGGYEVAFSVYCDRTSRICLVVGHTNAGSNPPNIFTLKIDEYNGDLLDSKVYDFGYSEYFDVVKPVFDWDGKFRGFVCGGRAENYPMVVRINIEGEIWGGSSYIISVSFSESDLSVESNSVAGYLTLSINPTHPSLSLSPTSVTSNEICKCRCYS